MDTLASLVDRDSLSNSTAAPQLSKHEDRSKILVAWLVLQLAGQVTLPFLVLTMLFHKKIARRNPAVINLCIVWTLATIPPLMLFYAGKQTGPQPNTLLCLAQAATSAAVPPMAATAYLTVVIHACSVVNNIINANAVRPVSFSIRTIFLMSSPYIVFLFFSLLVAIIGVQNPADVRRTLFFCEVANHHLSLPVFVFAIVVVLLTLIAQIWTSIMFYRNWSAKRRGSMAHRAVSHVDFQLLIRMLLFTLFEVIVVVSSIVAVSNPRMMAAEILLATPPFAVFLTFASSPDILRAWFPCFFPRKPVRTLADVQITTNTLVTTHWHVEDPKRSSMAPSITGPPVMAEVRPRTHDLEIGSPPASPLSSQREWISRSSRSAYTESYSSDSPLRPNRGYRPPEAPRPIHPKLVGRPI